MTLEQHSFIRSNFTDFVYDGSMSSVFFFRCIRHIVSIVSAKEAQSIHTHTHSYTHLFRYLFTSISTKEQKITRLCSKMCDTFFLFLLLFIKHSLLCRQQKYDDIIFGWVEKIFHFASNISVTKHKLTHESKSKQIHSTATREKNRTHTHTKYWLSQCVELLFDYY